MKKYRYQLRYCGAPCGDGEYEVVATCYKESGLNRLFDMKGWPKYYGNNAYVFDSLKNEKITGGDR